MEEVSSVDYSIEYEVFDFVVAHFLDSDEESEYNGAEDVLYARTERNGSTVIFNGRRDEESWLRVLSLNEGEELGPEYLLEMTDRRVESAREKARNAGVV